MMHAARQQQNNGARTLSLLFSLISLTAAACAPVASGSWYDTQKGKQARNFLDQVRHERRVRAANVPPNGLVTVGKGETYYKLSLRYKVPLRALLEINEARPPYTLSPGDRVKVPMQAFYEVQPKDTLYSISRRYETDVATLASLNGLAEPYAISVGQKLQVPGKRQNIAKPKRQVSRAKPTPTARQEQPSRPILKRTKPVKKASLPQAPRRVGRFQVPLKGPIISGYGPKEGGLHNDGINIAARTGTPIKAAENGVVVYAGNELRGYGNLLLLRHSDGWVSAYAHISNFRVKPGDRVKQGQTIAEVGQTGNVDRPQLHFELRKGTRAVNPNSLI
ncbi:MAG: peptidoglycan DD-metalloendopeptidase family protein [Parvibaculales bacterium]